MIMLCAIILPLTVTCACCYSGNSQSTATALPPDPADPATCTPPGTSVAILAWLESWECLEWSPAFNVCVHDGLMAGHCMVIPISTGTRVSQQDVNLLWGFLCHCAYKWEAIGSVLGFLPGELKNIAHSSPRSSVQHYLKEVLSQWAHWPTTNHPQVPTLERLCAALRSDLVGLGDVAQDLSKQTLHH